MHRPMFRRGFRAAVNELRLAELMLLRVVQTHSVYVFDDMMHFTKYKKRILLIFYGKKIFYGASQLLKEFFHM